MLLIVLVILIGIILCLASSGGYVLPNHITPNHSSDWSNRVVVDNTKGEEEDVHNLNHVTYNSFVKSANYFTKIMLEYVHAVNVTNCWMNKLLTFGNDLSGRD